MPDRASIGAARIGGLEHHEVIQVPVQDAGRAQLDELLELEAQRARREVSRPAACIR